ncbi:MAG: hypothetical protein II794_01720 [Oscillospiraceae bacterium]|nr:hypothetical protein [Oscillospiraceae bacterium]
MPSKPVAPTFKNGFGIDVELKKIDSFGNKLAGAVFTVYTDAACTQVKEVTVGNAKATTVTADANGVVKFRVPKGTYYLKETAVPNDTFLTNNNVYTVVVVDKDTITWTASNGADVAKYGVMNIPKETQSVILKKTDNARNPLSGAKFEILRYDRTKVAGTEGSESLDSGVFWTGELNYGTYYIHETQVPEGYEKLATGDNWFILTVRENTVTVSDRLTEAP